MADAAHKYELHAQYVTYKAGTSIAYNAAYPNGSEHVGKVVMHNGDDIVDLVTDELEICGKLIKVEPDGFCTVQDEGYADVPCDTVTYAATNNRVVGSTTAGKVKVADTAVTATAVAGGKSIKSDGTGRCIIKFT
jgi:hypothetical protein